MKILIIRFSSIGDIVLTTPIIRCVKNQLENVTIHYLTKKVFTPILNANPYISIIHSFENDIRDCIQALREEHYDIIIDLHKNLRTTFVKRALMVGETYQYNKLNLPKWIYVNFKVNLLPDKSIVDRYFEGIKKLKVNNDGQGLDYFIPEEDVIKNQDIPMSHWAGYIACVVGGSYFTKKLPIDKWIEICNYSPIPIILLGGPEDRDFAEEIAQKNPIKIYNSCGKFKINESANLIKNARLVISNDTGLMHIAAAFKKPIVSLWGNTTPQMGMFPYYGFNNLKSNIAPNHLIIENNELSCRPCSKIGFETCPKKHFKCMNDLKINQIEKFIIKYI